MELKNISLRDVTLLDKFMVEKANNYIEPLRKGTPRGEPIGVSGKKYWATLLCLKKIPLKQMASMLKVSYGLLRKWRTEDAFWDLFEGHCVEFADVVIQHLEERAKKQLELHKGYMAKSIDVIFRTPPPLLTVKEFSDIKSYHRYLVEQILKRLGEYGKEFQETSENLDDIFKDDQVLPTILNERVEKVIFSEHLAFQCRTFFELLKASISTAREMKKSISNFERPREEMLELIKTIAWKGKLDNFQQKLIIVEIYKMQNRFNWIDLE